jgi:MoaA/NifB/PqqE/SkfB family radical SAM enzyme
MSDLQSGELDPQQNVYRTDKIAHHPDRLHSLRRGSVTVPVTLRLSISDLCNHDCAFCSFRMEDNANNAWFGETEGERRNNNPSRKIPFARAKNLLAELARAGVRAVEFTGGGEPTAHPDHQQIFSHCLELGLEAALITNGQRLRESLDAVLTRFTWVRISVDAANAATWAGIRRVQPAFFDRVVCNAKRLIEHRDRTGSETLIGAGFVVYEQNWREIYSAVRMFKEIGFDSVRLSALFNSSEKVGHFDGFKAEAAALCTRAKDEFEDSRFHVANNFNARLDDLTMGRGGQKRCWYQELAPFIGGDQRLYRCCNTAYTPEGDLGSLREKTFGELWNEVSTNGSLHLFRPDQKCGLCMFNDRNVMIESLVADGDRTEAVPARHVNFV